MRLFFTSLIMSSLLLMVPLRAALAFAFDAVASIGRMVAGHLHLMPATPRSIVQTRRLGLA